MIDRWQHGDWVLPEEFLARHPPLAQHAEAVADLIYEELCLREEYRCQRPLQEFVDRFPEWREQLELLFDCQRLLGPVTRLQFPTAGKTFGDFRLLGELGAGPQSRVFLARQTSLADRAVVVKFTSCDVGEHLSLARLQHTHIVPLYSVHDHPDRGLRALCMPYFGGESLSRILEAIECQPRAKRTGGTILDFLDRLQSGRPITIKSDGPVRQALRNASYEDALCWIGACLAGGLQYAHERGLVHLDLKPSNVLLAADGLPMLLDFHLAREPVIPGQEPPCGLGGTEGYMSPEQTSALHAVQRGRAPTLPIDGRSDIYSLGVVLYESLTGTLPPSGSQRIQLCLRDVQVSPGLTGVVSKCLAANPADRYADMAGLAMDLWRHLRNLPLRGVRNRNFAERWRKWRRRRPYGMVLALTSFMILMSGLVLVAAVRSHFDECMNQVHTAVEAGEAQIAAGDWDRAIRTLQRGRSAARGLPMQDPLLHELDVRLQAAEQERASARRAACLRNLHQIADQVRFLYAVEDIPSDSLQSLEQSCVICWERRNEIVEGLEEDPRSRVQETAREDLLELAIFRAGLQMRLLPPRMVHNARSKAITILAAAEDFTGRSIVIDAERAFYPTAWSKDVTARPAAGYPRACAQTAWEHYALGRLLLKFDRLQEANAELARAVRLQPQRLWPNFYQGRCFYRLGRYIDAVAAYSVSIGAAPHAAGSFYNRALAFAALGQSERANRDYNEAVRLDPSLASFTPPWRNLSSSLFPLRR
jgi:serine/threonine protein kinase